MSDSPLRRLSVPNTLHLDLYTGVLVPALFKCSHVIAVVCPSVRRGTAGAALPFDSLYYVTYLLFFSDRDTGCVQCKL